MDTLSPSRAAASRDDPSPAATPWQAGRFGKAAGPRRVLFGQMYEDTDIEQAAFATDARVFCIASAGDTAMALAAPGSRRTITAVDINPVQLDYARARLAGAPAVVGSAERVMGFGRGAMALFGWRREVLEHFLQMDDPAQQLAYWHTRLETLGFRTTTDLALSISGLKTVYASPFLSFLPDRFGRVLRGRLARCFGTFPNRTNPYARALLLGGPPPAPAFDASRITLVGGDAATLLEGGPAGRFDAFTLSNILDGTTAAYRRRLFAAVRHAAAPGAVIVLRSFAEPLRVTAHDAAARDHSILWGVVDVRPVDALSDDGVPIPLPRR